MRPRTRSASLVSIMHASMTRRDWTGTWKAILGGHFLETQNQAIGARHHYVPRFYLARFANSSEQIRQTDRLTMKSVVTNVKNCAAERDFNTFVNVEGHLDGRLEQLLTAIEHDAAPAIREVCNPLIDFPPRPEVRNAICALVAFQKARGRGTRRTIEALGDTMQKFMLRDLNREAVRERLSSDGAPAAEDDVESTMSVISEIDNYEFLPDPNEHLGLIGPIALRICEVLLARPMFLAEFAGPILLTCDEPVSLYRYRKDTRRGVGVLDADEIWLPLDPRRVLIFAQPGIDLAEKTVYR